MRRLVAVAIINILFALHGAAVARDTLSKKAFTAEVAAHIKRANPKFKVIVADEETVKVHGSDDATFDVFTHNAYQEYKQAPAEMTAIIDRYTASVLSLSDTASKISRSPRACSTSRLYPNSILTSTP